MPGKLILLGDNICHGGTVIEASPESFAGTPVARWSDMPECPTPGFGVNPIAAGDTRLTVDGKPVARISDMTASGAVLIASQALTTDEI